MLVTLLVTIPLFSTPVNADPSICFEGKVKVCDDFGCVYYETPKNGLCFGSGETPIGGGEGTGGTGGTGGSGGGGSGTGGGVDDGGKKVRKKK